MFPGDAEELARARVRVPDDPGAWIHHDQRLGDALEQVAVSSLHLAQRLLGGLLLDHPAQLGAGPGDPRQKRIVGRFLCIGKEFDRCDRLLTRYGRKGEHRASAIFRIGTPLRRSFAEDLVGQSAHRARASSAPRAAAGCSGARGDRGARRCACRGRRHPWRIRRVPPATRWLRRSAAAPREAHPRGSARFRRPRARIGEASGRAPWGVASPRELTHCPHVRGKGARVAEEARCGRRCHPPPGSGPGQRRRAPGRFPEQGGAGHPGRHGLVSAWPEESERTHIAARRTTSRRSSSPPSREIWCETAAEQRGARRSDQLLQGPPARQLRSAEEVLRDFAEAERRFALGNNADDRGRRENIGKVAAEDQSKHP